MEEGFLTFQTLQYIYFKPKGEVCNYLPAGTRVKILQYRDEWINITWRGGKKKGWVLLKSLT